MATLPMLHWPCFLNLEGKIVNKSSAIVHEVFTARQLSNRILKLKVLKYYKLLDETLLPN